jgi:CRP-like cAMP-binding protein
MRSSELAELFEDAVDRPFDANVQIVAYGGRSEDYGGRPGDLDVFLIREGLCKVYVSPTRQTARREQLVSLVGAGHLIGELSVMLARPRSSNVRTLTKVTCRVLRGRTFALRVSKSEPARSALLDAALREVARLTEGMLVRGYRDEELLLLYHLCHVAALIDPQRYDRTDGAAIELHITKEDLFGMMGRTSRGNRADPMEREWRRLVEARAIGVQPLQINDLPKLKERLEESATAKGIALPLLLG